MKELKVENELSTLQHLQQGASIARFGDGELRLAAGMTVGHQAHHPKLMKELQHILHEPTKCLVGVPYISNDSPRAQTWRHYDVAKYTQLYNKEKQYYSAFITRPDSAPWIDNTHYWNSLASIWHKEDVIIVSGSGKGFRQAEMQSQCNIIKFIDTLPTQAYEEIDNIEKEIGDATGKIVLLCVGATATVLAWRLAEKGYRALDLGHVPMFMRRRGLFKGDEANE